MVSFLVLIPIAVIAVVGIGLLIAYLAKQTKGAKQALDEGRRRQAELDDQIESEGRDSSDDAES